MSKLRELAVESVRDFLRDDCTSMAAGIAYYALFSIFPLLLGLIALLGLLLEPAQVQKRLLEMTSQAFPASADLVRQNIEAVVASRGAIGLISVLGLFWSASALFAAIRKSLNRAWNLERERPLLKQKLIEFSMAAGVGLLFLLSVTITAVIGVAWQLLPPEVRMLEESCLWRLAAGLLPLVFSFMLFAMVYRFVPNTTVTWGDVWPGATLAAVLFEAAKNLFAWYLASFANYALVYGSLATVIVFLLWTYISALILLAGAEFAAVYTRLFGSQRTIVTAPVFAEGSSGGSPDNHGRRETAVS